MAGSRDYTIHSTVLVILLLIMLVMSNTSCSPTKARNTTGGSPQGISDAGAQKNDEPVLLAVKVGEKCGYIDSSGKVVIEPHYDAAWDFAEGLGKVGVGGSYGYVDSSGNPVIELKYNDAHDFSEGLAAVCEGSPWDGTGKWGYIDKKGEYVIQPSFKTAMDFHEGFAIVGMADFESGRISGNFQMGCIDKTGNFVIKPDFNYIEDFSEGMAVIIANMKWGYIDKTGKVVVQPQFGMAKKFSGGLAAVCVGDCFAVDSKAKWGFVDKTGNMVIEAKYDAVDDFSEGLAPVRILADEKYTDITGASHYLTEGAHDMRGIRGRWAYVDRTGQIVIDPNFDGAQPFSEGFAAVCIGNPFDSRKGKWGFVDKTGNYVIDPRFGIVAAFSHGLSHADIEGWTGFINGEGAFTWSTVATEPELPPLPDSGTQGEQE